MSQHWSQSRMMNFCTGQEKGPQKLLKVAQYQITCQKGIKFEP